MRFELFIATRYLRAKRRQAFIGIITAISVLGVAAGVILTSLAFMLVHGSQLSFAWAPMLMLLVVGSAAQYANYSNVRSDLGRDGHPVDCFVFLVEGGDHFRRRMIQVTGPPAVVGQTDPCA